MENEREINAVSFTGHRIIPPAHIAPLNDLIDRAIAFLYDKGCRSFYCGGAIGFDTMAAKRVILFRLSHPDCRLHLLLPCRDQASRWSEDDLVRYEFVLAEANTVRYVSDEYTDGCMRERNKALAECSDVIVSYVYKEASGAAQTARIAKSLGKTVYNLYTGLSK